MTCTGNPYTCDCPACHYENALESYYECLAETGSSAYMLYGNASDANRVAYAECGPRPRPEDFGLAPEPPRVPAPPAPVDPDDIPF
jgi:hypothetical protein